MSALPPVQLGLLARRRRRRARVGGSPRAEVAAEVSGVPPRRTEQRARGETCVFFRLVVSLSSHVISRFGASLGASLVRAAFGGTAPPPRVRALRRARALAGSAEKPPPPRRAIGRGSRPGHLAEARAESSAAYSLNSERAPHVAVSRAKLLELERLQRATDAQADIRAPDLEAPPGESTEGRALLFPCDGEPPIE